MISKVINDVVKYCSFIHKAFARRPKPGLVLLLVSMWMPSYMWGPGHCP